jgi:hypothetical protein
MVMSRKNNSRGSCLTGCQNMDIIFDYMSWNGLSEKYIGGFICTSFLSVTPVLSICLSDKYLLLYGRDAHDNSDESHHLKFLLSLSDFNQSGVCR